MKVTIALSRFHRRLGPILPFQYPEDTLQEKDKNTIADLMNQPQTVPFSYSLGNLYTMNYCFEIYSSIARGKKEMLLISIITENQAPNVERQAFSLCIEFSKNVEAKKDAFALKVHEDYKAFQAKTAVWGNMSEKVYWNTMA